MLLMCKGLFQSFYSINGLTRLVRIGECRAPETLQRPYPQVLGESEHKEPFTSIGKRINRNPCLVSDLSGRRNELHSLRVTHYILAHAFNVAFDMS